MNNKVLHHKNLIVFYPDFIIENGVFAFIRQLNSIEFNNKYTVDRTYFDIETSKDYLVIG